MFKRIALTTLALTIFALPALAQPFEDVKWIECLPGVTLCQSERDLDDDDIDMSYRLDDKACLNAIKAGLEGRGYKLVNEHSDYEDPEEIEITMHKGNLELDLELDVERNADGTIYELNLHLERLD